jgi:amino acid transporter
VEPEFQTALLVVLIAGSVIFGTATLVLFLAFRAAKGNRPMNMNLIGALVMFVFVCCLLLFALSYAAER